MFFNQVDFHNLHVCLYSCLFQNEIHLYLGANHCWFADGYDKLKPYGFPIYGAIDGFSRRIIWLNITRSNNHPLVPAYFYKKASEELKLIPALLQTDCGTETGLMAGMQCALHQNSEAHRFVKSVTNQRIENWWSYLRRHYSSWVIQFFRDLIDAGYFKLGHEFYMECSWYVFKWLIQRDLDENRALWNSHYIRKSQPNTIGGIPNDLFFLPERCGFYECGTTVTTTDFDRILGNFPLESDAKDRINNSDSNLIEYFDYIVSMEGMQYPPRNWLDGRNMFVTIIRRSGY